ncbi:unnamed protein product, partial [Owenia fusiformis]
TCVATHLRSSPQSSGDIRKEDMLRKSSSISQAERVCKEGHPNWHNKETSLFCDSSVFVKSCKNKCGSKTGQCFCDLDCFQYGDCCPDFIESCSYNLMNKTNVLDINSSERGKYECVAINGTMYVYLVSSCDLAYYDTPLEVSCKTPKDGDDEVLSLTPALDLETGVVYKNIDCARCNNVKEPKLWAIQTICEEKILTDRDVKNPGVNFIKKILTSESCSFGFIVPNNAKVRSCMPTEYKCPSCANDTLSNLCATSGLHPVQAATGGPYPDHGIVYHNKFCWFCANPTFMNIRSCHIKLGYRSSAQFELFSFQILVDVSVDNKRKLNVRSSSGIHSVDFELECTTESSCMAVVCPNGYMKNEERCVLKGKLVQTNVSATTTNENMKVYTKILEDLLQDTFIPTGYVNYDQVLKDRKSDNRYTQTIMRFNISFPENVTKLDVNKYMTNKYETFVKLAKLKDLSQVNMTYVILPPESVNQEPFLDAINSTSSLAAIWSQLITLLDIFLFIIITFAM